MQCKQIGPVYRILLVAATMFALTFAPRRASAAYDYAYGVNDPSTGDVKDQQESRDGNQITGYYRLLDADGLTRTVKYASNPLTGFQAHVTRELDPLPLDQAPAMEQRGAIAYPAMATSYQQFSRPMTGYRHDTVHPTVLGSGYRAANGVPIIAAYDDYEPIAAGNEK